MARRRPRRGGGWKTAKASWYGGPNDSQDNNKPASGIPNTIPGIALLNRGTLGDTFEVRDRKTGKTVRVRHSDIGPAKWTGKGLDINPPALKALGYSEKNFPTGQRFDFRRIGKGAQGVGQTGADMAKGGRRNRRGRTRGGTDPDTATAQASGEVRYGPQEAQLRQLARTAGLDLEGDVEAANAAADSAKLYAKAAAPKVDKIYKDALQSADFARDDVTRAFGALGAAADPYRAVTSRELGGWRNRVAGSASEALGALKNRQQEAEAGRGFAINKARSDYRKTQSQISQSASDLLGQKGAFVAGEIGKTKQEKAELRARTQSQNRQIRATRSNQEDQQAEQRARDRINADRSLSKEQRDRKFQKWKTQYAASHRSSGGGGGGGGSGTTNKNGATRSELKSFQTNFRRALGVASRIAKDNPRSLTARTLTEGSPKTKTDPAVGKIDDQLAISMALDMAYDGHISRANARAIKNQRGINVAGISGAKSYADWKPTGRVTTPRRRNARARGGSRPT